MEIVVVEMKGKGIGGSADEVRIHHFISRADAEKFVGQHTTNGKGKYWTKCKVVQEGETISTAYYD